MENAYTRFLDFTGKSIIVTGGSGVLGGGMARALYQCGANVTIVGQSRQSAERMVTKLAAEGGPGNLLAAHADVLEPEAVQAVMDTTITEYGQIDGLVNCAGGNKPAASTNAEKRFFDLPTDALRWVFDLNLLGTVIPSQVAGRHMAERKQGVIINIASVNSYRPLTRIPAYSAAKAGVSNFTLWLATYMAQEFSPRIRVNAIAPGFFLTEQNRFLLLEQDGVTLTERGQKIMNHIPMARFGTPDDLSGALLWLLSDAAAYVTGIVLPVDGGFTGYSGI